jgi:hypothetical protein
MLPADVVRRVREIAGDNAALQFSNASAVDWINDAIRETVVENSLLQAVGTQNTVVGQQQYVLPADMFKLHSVYVDKYKVQVMTLQEWEDQNRGEPGVDIPTGDTWACYVYAGVLNLYPIPDSIVELKINYTKFPQTIVYTEPAGVPTYTPNTLSIREEFHNRIVVYCLAQVALQDDDFEKHALLMQQFKTGVIELKDSDKTDDLYPFISVSSRDTGDDW